MGERYRKRRRKKNKKERKTKTHIKFGSFKNPTCLTKIPASTQALTYLARYSAYAPIQLTPLQLSPFPSPLTPQSQPPISSLPFVFIYPGALQASAMNCIPSSLFPLPLPPFPLEVTLKASLATQTCPLSTPSQANPPPIPSVELDPGNGCGEFIRSPRLSDELPNPSLRIENPADFSVLIPSKSKRRTSSL